MAKSKVMKKAAKSNPKKPVRVATSGRTKKIGVAGAVSVAVLGGGILVFVSSQSQASTDTYTPTYSITVSEHEAAKSNLAGLRSRTDDAIPPEDYRNETMPSWDDNDKNGCSTREDILRRDLFTIKLDKKNECKIISGKLYDYYIGETIVWDDKVSGGGIDIDHIVSKADAWDSGGYKWGREAWRDFVNDPDVLLSVSASINRQKGDKNVVQWLPPNEAFWCRFVVVNVNIKAKYSLTITNSEEMVMSEILNGRCETTE